MICCHSHCDVKILTVHLILKISLKPETIKYVNDLSEP